jgi:hypothetical protein
MLLAQKEDSPLTLSTGAALSYTPRFLAIARESLAQASQSGSRLLSSALIQGVKLRLVSIRCAATPQ